VTYKIEFKLLAPKGSKEGKVGDKIMLPKNRYNLIEPYLQMFCNSSAEACRSDGQHLVLLTGPEKSGKSSVVRESLARFRSRKFEMQGKKRGSSIPFDIVSTPESLEDSEKLAKFDNEFCITLEIDFENNFMMKPEAAFHHVHRQIIGEVLQFAESFQKVRREPVLDSELVKEIVLANNSHEYAFVYVKDVVFTILNGCDEIFFSAEGIKKLEIFNERLLETNCFSFFDKSPSNG
jgi:hypothetical protein